MAECFFKEKYGKDCKPQEKLCHSKGPSRIQSIIAASKTYRDDLHLRLEREFATGNDISLSYHKNCVSRYTSKTNLVHHQKAATDTQGQEQPTKKRLRRSEEQFDFKNHCGKLVLSKKTPKNGFAAQRNNLTSRTTACTVVKLVLSKKTPKTHHDGDHHTW